MTRIGGTRIDSKPRLNLVGQKFERLTVEEWIPAHDNICGKWKCRCNCGNLVLVPTHSLKSGNTKSCGCFRKGIIKPRSFEGEYTDKHRPRLYWTWINMIRRCENPKAPDYYRYGAIGITVCEEWHDLPTFLNWAYTHDWQEGLTLDRINNNGNYEPENCRWADVFTQGNNRRTNTLWEYNGKTMTLAQWSRKTGLSSETLLHRKKAGWTIEEILTTPKGVKPPSSRAKLTKFIEYNNEIHTPSEWSNLTGLSRGTICSRLRSGWAPEDILTKPVQKSMKKH